MLSKLPRTPNWCALTQYRPINFALLDAIMLLKMWLDPGAPPQLAGVHIPPRGSIGSQLVHSLSIVYPLKLIRAGCGTRFRGMRSLTFAACGKKKIIFNYFHNLPLSQKLDPRLVTLFAWFSSYSTGLGLPENVHVCPM